MFLARYSSPNPVPDASSPAPPCKDVADQRSCLSGQKRILAIWTRDLDGSESVGRINTARSVRSVLLRGKCLSSVRLFNQIERPTLAGLAGVCWTLVHGLLSGRPVPLQCAIFAHSPTAKEALKEASRCEVIYLDGVRTLWLLRRLRKQNPKVRVVVDFDDLMSRRFAEILALRLPLSSGYLEKSLPRPVLALMSSRFVARTLLRYEHWALQDAERTVLLLAQSVVLVNHYEADLLRDAGSRLHASTADVVVIPPPAPALRSPPPDAKGHSWRAIFIGTDRLVQNRLTIDFLLDLWERESPGLALVIYGRQHRPVRPIRNVVYAGFVGDISEAYAPGSIMLCPVFLPGGIKTKILESFAHGTPVAGNRASFEGLALPDYPLCFEGAAELAHFLRRPGDCEKTIRSAINIARQCLQSEHSGEIFQSRWEAVVGLSTVPEAQNPGSPEWR